MFKFRVFPLLATGLFTSFGAAAQATTMSPANQDMLSWMLRVLLGAICLVAVLAGIVLTTVATSSPTYQQQPAASTPAAPASKPVAPASVAASPNSLPAALAPAAPQVTERLVRQELPTLELAAS